MVTLDDTRTRIIAAAIKAVRQYGLEGVRIQNVSELAGISAGAIYRHFEGKDQLLVECFTYVDKQAAAIFEHLKFNPLLMLTDPMGAVRALWIPYFRFWVIRLSSSWAWWHTPLMPALGRQRQVDF